MFRSSSLARHVAWAGIASLAALAAFFATPVRADEASTPAREWRSYCKAYLGALEGGGNGGAKAPAANDLDVTYCLGVTKGLLTGLRVGSQIGALSFGSRLSVQFKLDRDAVFKQFEAQDPNRLLGICAPADARMPDFVRPVLARLDKNPGDAERPIAEVFYEALSEAYPCP
jgi:hypothetical protein